MLHKSEVIFDSEHHSYTLDGVQLEGITGMISRQLFPNKYDNIPENVVRKAAERGSLIHSQCQIFDDMGVDMGAEEVTGYKCLIDRHGLQYETSEYLVSDNKHYASCIDKVYREDKNTYHLGDIKTTYKLDKEYVRWQLSVYAYLFELQNPNVKVGRLFAIYLRGDKAELVDVERIPKEVIIDLMDCDVKGIQFDNPYNKIDNDNSMPVFYREMEQSIIDIDSQCRYWANKKKELTDGVMREMVKAGAYSWKGDSISFTRKKDSIRKDFDKKAFEKDYPELYKEYLKDTPVVGSVTLKVS